ncbi:MAG: LysR family transcriptional regulator [Rhizobiales bacterium]|nr:LysR family transcriptional regulator [Hyphomicrobiales bacterium]
MPALDPKRLIELLRIAQHGSYTRAAAAQGVSQPALSNSMAVLEKSLGVRVLERARHGATLTDVGRMLVGHAEAIDAVLARAASDVELKQHGLEGSLILGVSPIACADIVPDALARLKREIPNIAIHVWERPDDDLTASLRSGEIDVMISPTGLMTDPPDIECHVLLHDIFVVILRREHALARLNSVSLSELRGQEWVMPNEHTTMRRQIEALFAAENEPWPMSCITTDSITGMKSIVIRSNCVSVASARLMRLEAQAGYLACLPLSKPHFVREICLRHRRQGSLTPVAQRFIATIHAVAKEMRRAGL